MGDKYYEFKVGGRFSYDWKRDFPPVVALLFADADIATVATTPGEEEETVVARQDVRAALSHLANMGLSPTYFETVWSQFRENARAFASGYLRGLESGAEAAQRQEEREFRPHPDLCGLVANLRERLESISASDEIEAAVDLLRRHGPNQWNDNFVEPDEALLPSLPGASFKELREPSVLEASTIGAFLGGARESLAEIVWLFEIYLMLRATPPDDTVEFSFASEFVADEESARKVLLGACESIVDKIALYQRTFSALVEGAGFMQRRLQRVALRAAWDDVLNVHANTHEKGRRLESFVEQLINACDDLVLIGKNLATETEELDLVVKNNVGRPFWTALASPVILVECKNWSTPVGAPEARILESKMRGRGGFARMSLFIAVNGTTRPFVQHVSGVRRDGIQISIVEADDVNELLSSDDLFPLDWLETLRARSRIT